MMITRAVHFRFASQSTSSLPSVPGMIMSRTIVGGWKASYASMNPSLSVVTRTTGAELFRDVLQQSSEGGLVVADQQSLFRHPSTFPASSPRTVAQSEDHAGISISGRRDGEPASSTLRAARAARRRCRHRARASFSQRAADEADRLESAFLHPKDTGHLRAAIAGLARRMPIR